MKLFEASQVANKHLADLIRKIPKDGEIPTLPPDEVNIFKRETMKVLGKKFLTTFDNILEITLIIYLLKLVKILSCKNR